MYVLDANTFIGRLKSQNPERRRKELEELSAFVMILPFGPAEAAAAAYVRADLERVGLTIGPYDVLIAGTALSHRAIMVTNNTDEFSRVRGLVVEDWL